jgi:hypothetical protein
MDLSAEYCNSSLRSTPCSRSLLADTVRVGASKHRRHILPSWVRHFMSPTIDTSISIKDDLADTQPCYFAHGLSDFRMLGLRKKKKTEAEVKTALLPSNIVFTHTICGSGSCDSSSLSWLAMLIVIVRTGQ